MFLTYMRVGVKPGLWTLDWTVGLDRWTGPLDGTMALYVRSYTYVAAGQAGPPTRLCVTITSLHVARYERLRVALHAMIAETTVPWSGCKR